METDKIESCNMECILFSLLSPSSTYVCLRPSFLEGMIQTLLDRNEMRFFNYQASVAYYSCFLEPEQISTPRGQFSGMVSLLNQVWMLAQKMLPDLFSGRVSLYCCLGSFLFRCTSRFLGAAVLRQSFTDHIKKN